MIAVPATSSAQVFVSFSLMAPPPLPVYQQPQLANPNYIWTPGYWAYGSSGYYWVAGSWEQPPQAGLLWTPGYWGYSQNGYAYNQGYWAPQVGYYGGINYGNGYYGNGYNGGSWQGNNFRYNTAVSSVNTTYVRNVYVDQTVMVRNSNAVSYNGGSGGVRMSPNANQRALEQQRHVSATSVQQQRVTVASKDRKISPASIAADRPNPSSIRSQFRRT